MINKPEFVGLQVSVLIRSDAGQSKDVLLFLDSVEFKAEMQEKLATMLKDTLQENKVPFHEVIISLDRPPDIAKPVERKPAKDKGSMLGRLFGKE